MNRQHPTFNIEHSTSNGSQDASGIERSEFDVECGMFLLSLSPWQRAGVRGNKPSPNSVRPSRFHSWTRCVRKARAGLCLLVLALALFCGCRSTQRSISNSGFHGESSTYSSDPAFAYRGGCETILCHWGLLESAEGNAIGKPVSWVPVVHWLVPDKRQQMRIRLKLALIDVRTGVGRSSRPNRSRTRRGRLPSPAPVRINGRSSR
jgi:hypothetical protein